MKMCDKKIGGIGLYENFGGLNKEYRFGDYMRIGCDTGIYLFETKKWIAMIEHSKFTRFIEYNIIGNIRYIINKLKKKN